MGTARPGRRLALLSVAIGVAVLAVSALVFQEKLIESFWIWRLGSGDPETVTKALEKLSAIGSARTAQVLLERLAATSDNQDVAGEKQVARALAGMKPRTPECYAVLIQALRRLSTLQAATVVLAGAWPDSKQDLGRFLGEGWPDGDVQFYQSLQSILDEKSAWSWMSNPRLSAAEHAREIPRYFARNHAKPEVRALSLSFCAEDAGILKEVFADDSHSLVKRAAIRIAGYLGWSPKGLDLSDLLRRETDPALLKEVVEARCLWASRQWAPETFELTDGIDCSWLRFGPTTQPRGVQDLKRLEEILEHEGDPALRDAASGVLAFPHREWLRQSDSPSPTLPRLKVHEWGVWRDREGDLVPAENLIADLPPFIHRSQVTAQEIWRERAYKPSLSLKPVLFFYTSEPVSVLLRVGFQQGRPWTFYPDATDYLAPPRPVADSAEVKSTAPGAFEDREGVSPPWLVMKAKSQRKADTLTQAGGPDRPMGELRSRYEIAPWLRPNHGRPHALGEVELAGMGLEWCGLRLGYGAKLEGDLHPVSPDSWWAALRDVGSSGVALRGEHEKFLFYDGAVHLLPPIRFRWRDAGRKGLSLEVASFEDYPLDLEALYDRRQPPPTLYVPAVFVVRVESGRAPRGKLLRRLPSDSGAIALDLATLDLEGDAVRQSLGAVLEEQGLTREEAGGLLRTWEKEFFAQDGLRAIAVLPRWLYDFMLPLEILPEPGELVRVGLVWKEITDLEIEKPRPEPPPKSECVPRPLQVSELPIKIDEQPLEPGPEEPFTIARDGRLPGFDVRGHTVLLSGDGKTIALPGTGPEGHDIRLYDLDSMKARRLIRFPPGNDIEDYGISADGNRVSLIVDEKDSIAVYVADARKGTLLEARRTRAQCTWGHLSSDGKKLVFLEDRRPILVDLEARRASVFDLHGSLSCEYPTLSLDGDHLALVAWVDELESRWGAVLLDLAKRTIAVLGRSETHEPFPSLSADGRRALFGFHLADIASCRFVRLAGESRNQGGHPFLSQDGRDVVFVLRGALWKTDLETGISRKAFSIPGREVHDASVSANGKRVLFKAVDPANRKVDGVYLVEIE